MVWSKGPARHKRPRASWSRWGHNPRKAPFASTTSAATGVCCLRVSATRHDIVTGLPRARCSARRGKAPRRAIASHGLQRVEGALGACRHPLAFGAGGESTPPPRRAAPASPVCLGWKRCCLRARREAAPFRPTRAIIRVQALYTSGFASAIAATVSRGAAWRQSVLCVSNAQRGVLLLGARQRRCGVPDQNPKGDGHLAAWWGAQGLSAAAWQPGRGAGRHGLGSGLRRPRPIPLLPTENGLSAGQNGRIGAWFRVVCEKPARKWLCYCLTTRSLEGQSPKECAAPLMSRELSRGAALGATSRLVLSSHGCSALAPHEAAACAQITVEGHCEWRGVVAGQGVRWRVDVALRPALVAKTDWHLDSESPQSWR